MIQYLKDLPIGSTVIYAHHEYPQYAFDTNLNPIQYEAGTFNVVWKVAAQNGFAPNTTTLWADRPLERVEYGRQSWNTGQNMRWIGTKLQKHCEAFYETFPQAMKDRVVPVYLDNEIEPECVSIFSFDELYFDGSPGKYLGDELDKTSDYYNINYWTRSYDKGSENQAWVMSQFGVYPNLELHNKLFGFRPFVNLQNDVVVTHKTMFGHHVMYDKVPEEPVGFVKVKGVWKPLHGIKHEGSVK